MVSPRHGGHSEIHASLLPLVDILFTATGIFLILIVMISALKQRQTLAPAQADAIIVCYPKDKYLYYDRKNPFGREFCRGTLTDDILETVLSRDGKLRLLAAFGADSFQEKEVLERGFDAVWERLREIRAKGFSAGLDVMWFPLGERGLADLPIIQNWQKGKE